MNDLTFTVEFLKPALIISGCFNKWAMVLHAFSTWVGFWPYLLELTSWVFSYFIRHMSKCSPVFDTHRWRVWERWWRAGRRAAPALGRPGSSRCWGRRRPRCTRPCCFRCRRTPRTWWCLVSERDPTEERPRQKKSRKTHSQCIICPQSAKRRIAAGEPLHPCFIRAEASHSTGRAR